jgi:hypothetical protein
LLVAPGGNAHASLAARLENEEALVQERRHDDLVHGVAPLAHLLEHRKRLRGHELRGKPGDISTELLQGRFANVAPFRAFGVLAAFVRRHKDLSPDLEAPENGFLASTVSDSGGGGQGWRSLLRQDAAYGSRGTNEAETGFAGTRLAGTCAVTEDEQVSGRKKVAVGDIYQVLDGAVIDAGQ